MTAPAGFPGQPSTGQERHRRESRLSTGSTVVESDRSGAGRAAFREPGLKNPLQTAEKAPAHAPGLSDPEKKEPTASQKAKKDEEVGGATARATEASSTDGSIKVKQLSWQEAAGLMFTEYIVIAILSFPSSFSVLGMAGGTICTIIVGLTVLYTSHVLWRYCMAHPKSTDICDLSSRLFPPRFRKIAWTLTSIAFLLNNLFIMGLHTLSGSVALNTLSNHSLCTVVFTVIMAAVCFVLSLVRELNQVALFGFLAAATMFLALLLCLIFLGVEAGPAGWVAGEPITIRAWAAPGTDFVAGFNALLNITYTYVGQILIPSYVDDMKRPQDFPKALYLCTAAEVVLFTLGGAIGYYLIGDEYITSPAYGSLVVPYNKIVAGFTMPTLIVVGVLYSNVTARFIFLRIFDVDSKHRLEHTVKGWTVWILIVLGTWVIAWAIGAGIPFFNDLLSLMSSLFDWYFGFAMEGLAFFALYKRGARWNTPVRKMETCINALMLISGFFILVGGCYSSISAIINSYADGSVAGAFTCANNGF